VSASSKQKLGHPTSWLLWKALAEANPGKTIVGWEANGGFLTGVEVRHRNGTLAALPTRDAVLPMVEILVAAKEGGKPVSGAFSTADESGSEERTLLIIFQSRSARRLLANFPLAPFGVTRVVL
jgi:phosphomannomutase